MTARIIFVVECRMDERRPMSHLDTIPYEQIDPEIRYLIRLMNQFPGITTRHSCAGHRPSEETYVSFNADSRESLEALVKAFSRVGPRSRVIANQFEWDHIAVSVELDVADSVYYKMSVSGHPPHRQRLTLSEIEQALADSISRLQDKHPSYPTCASVRSEGN